MTYLVVQWLDLLLLLALADLVRVSHLEELGRDVHQPLRLDSGNIVAILPRCENQLVVDHPLRLAVEQRGVRMDVDWRAFHKRLVPFLWVFLRSITEEATTDGPTNPVVVAPC